MAVTTWDQMNQLLVQNGLTPIDDGIDLNDMVNNLLDHANTVKAQYGAMGQLMAADMESRIQTVIDCATQAGVI